MRDNTLVKFYIFKDGIEVGNYYETCLSRMSVGAVIMGLRADYREEEGYVICADRVLPER